MPIGKNSISRVAGEPAAEPAKVEAAPVQEKKTSASKPRSTTKTASATTKKSAPKKTAAPKTTAPKTAAPKAEIKTETVERIEKVAEVVTAPAKAEEVKAYVSINDELPTYLL